MNGTTNKSIWSPSHYCQHALISCIVATSAGPTVLPPYMNSLIKKNFDTRDPNVHSSIATILLV